MFSCCGARLHRGDPDEERPLLPRYREDTSRQRRLHEKLHSYQMVRALAQGYLPSTEQAVTLLRTLLSSELLAHEDDDRLSDPGKTLLRLSHRWLQQFIHLLRSKNSEDKLQDLVWFVTRSKVHVDVDRLEERAVAAKRNANIEAVRESASTAFGMLLSNPDFNLFLTDLSSIARQILQDTASTIGEVGTEAAKKLQKSDTHQGDVAGQSAARPSNGGHPSSTDARDQLREDAEEIAHVAAESATIVAQETTADIADQFSGEDREALLGRLKEAVSSLRKKENYSESASTVGNLIRRVLDFYSGLAVELESELESDVEFNKEAKLAVAKFWDFTQCFGDKEEWKAVERSLGDLMEECRENPEYTTLVRGVGDLVQDMLLDPAFFDEPEERFRELRDSAQKWKSNSEILDIMDRLLGSFGAAIRSVFEDGDVKRLLLTSQRIFNILLPRGKFFNEFLPIDMMHIIAPRVIQSIQYIPIPRMEVGSPAVDLLLETLVIEPGTTINNSSFLPFRFRVETRNSMEVQKARLTTLTTTSNLLTIKLDGLSIRAEEFSYLLHLRSGLFGFWDKGIASFGLDNRGIDVHIDVEVCRKCPETILSVKNVRVKVHHLNYQLQQSKFTCLAFLLKPLLRPALRKALEMTLARVVENGIQTLDRELLFARERWRAASIAQPDSLYTFVKAIVARMKNMEDSDVRMRMGIDAKGGVFKGMYTPASLVKVWEEEAVEAKKRVREGKAGGWRNHVFDVPVSGQ